MIGSLAGLGLSTVLGPSRAATMAGLAEEALGLRRMRAFIGSDYQPQLAALGEDPDDRTAMQQIGALSDQAIADLADQLSRLDMGPERTGVRVAVCLPEPDTNAGLAADTLQRLGAALVAAISRGTGLPVESSTLHFDGGAGPGAAIMTHRSAIAGGTSLLLLAADSFRCRRRLNAMIGAGLLFSGTAPYGLIPGEGAAAMLIRGNADGGLARLLGVGAGQDTVGEFDDGDSDYTALSDACHAALPKGSMLAGWFTDWNNSRYRAAELSYAQLRMASRLADDIEMSHLALLLGDTGAAGQGIAMALAATQSGVSLVSGSGPQSRARSVLAVAGAA